MAIKKTCPHCGKESFSAGAVPWICPYCGREIKDEALGEASVSVPE